MKVAFLPQTEEAAGLLRAYGPIRAVCDTYGWEAQLWPHKRQTGREFTLLNYMGPNRQQTVGMNPRQTYTIFQQEPPDTPLDMVLFHQPLGDHSWAIAELKRRDVTIVVDCDDDYLHIPPEYPTNEGLRARAFNNSIAHLEHTIRSADLVTVSTPALADTYRRWNPNIVVIRNGLWWPMWENVEHVERDYQSIGYVGGLQYRRFDLTVLRGIVGPWLKRRPDWKFVSVGAVGEEVHDYLEVPEGQRVTVPWGEYGDGWAATVGMIDVGLVPLQQNRFNQAKSHLKGMEHNAVGRVFIASPSESYDWYLTSDSDAGGAVAKRPRDWTRWLDFFADLSLDDFTYGEGNCGRAKAEALAINERAYEWRNAWAQAIEARRKAA